MPTLRSYPLIWLIRHAEKPDPGTGSPGLDEAGAIDPASLSRRGWRRSRRLADLLVQADPSALYAARSRPGSRRPEQTLQAAARRLRLPIRDAYGDGQAGELLADVLRQRGLVVVCWRHRELSDIVARLAPRAVKAWDADCYDRLWELRWMDGRWSFLERPLALLPGDRPSLPRGGEAVRSASSSRAGTSASFTGYPDREGVRGAGPASSATRSCSI